MPLENLCIQLGKHIRTIRETKQFTQVELSKKIDCDERTIQRIESGLKLTSFTTLQKIATAFEMDIEMLINVKSVELQTLKRKSYIIKTKL